MYRSPYGRLVVMVTRANICDMPNVCGRVLADELAIAADVFDIEPSPLNDPLLGRDNVVHTPHTAGRTRQANEAFAMKLAEQFSELKGEMAKRYFAEHTVRPRMCSRDGAALELFDL